MLDFSVSLFDVKATNMGFFARVGARVLGSSVYEELNEGVRLTEDATVKAITRVFTGKHLPRQYMERNLAGRRSLSASLSVRFASNSLLNFKHKTVPFKHTHKLYVQVLRSRNMKLVKGKHGQGIR